MRHFKIYVLSLFLISPALIACDDDEAKGTTTAGAEAGTPADSNGGTEGGADTGNNGGADTGDNAGTEGGVEAGTEGGVEAGTEGGVEAGTEGGDDGGSEGPAQNIVEIASETEGFSTLVAAVVAADLAETLSGEGPFTVLAPTDDAFEALPAEVLTGLLEDAENGGDKLANILKLHVIGGAVLSSALTDGQVVESLNGSLSVAITDGVVTFTSGETTATVAMADLEASNGVIHVIDTVLLPAEETAPQNIVEIASGNENFSTLVAAVSAAGFVETLSGEGPFTVFAPLNSAFEAIPEEDLRALLDGAANGETALAEILQLHVVSGAAVVSADLSDGQVVTTLNGDLTVNISDDGATLTTAGGTVANVVDVDIEASNGVIHVIDTVLQ